MNLLPQRQKVSLSNFNSNVEYFILSTAQSVNIPIDTTAIRIIRDILYLLFAVIVSLIVLVFTLFVFSSSASNTSISPNVEPLAKNLNEFSFGGENFGQVKQVSLDTAFERHHDPSDAEGINENHVVYVDKWWKSQQTKYKIEQLEIEVQALRNSLGEVQRQIKFRTPDGTLIKVPDHVDVSSLEHIGNATHDGEAKNKKGYYNMSAVLSPDALKKRKGEVILNKAKKVVYDFIDTISSTAISEMKIYKVPASITIAQALLESDAGRSKLARNNKNLFGVKCFSKHCKKGHCSNFTDDSHKDFFRKYKSFWRSIRHHSEFLQRKRYKSRTKDLKLTDYKKWAAALRQAGYATDKKYDKKLVRIIEKLELHKYDKQG